MQTLLVLNINPDLEEDLVDYLLSLPGVGGFTSYQVRGHGQHDDLSVAEQVTGRRKRVQVEMLLQEEEAARVLENLAETVGRDIQWWRHPVAASGNLGA